MGIKWVSTYQGLGNTNTWRIEILDANIVINPEVPFLCEYGPVISGDASGTDPFNPVISTEATVTMLVDRVGVEDFITQLVDSNENRFWLRIYKNSNVAFIGPIQLDDMELDDAPFPYAFKVTALDPIILLKQTEIDANLDGVDGLAAYDVHRYFAAIWSKTLLSEFYGAGAVFVEIYTRWSNAEMDAANEMFKNIGLQYQVFNKKDGNNLELATALEMLEIILRQFLARIYFSNGRYIIEQIDNRAENTTTLKRYRYDIDMSLIDVTPADTSLITTVDDITIKKRGSGKFNFLPPLRAVQIIYEHDPSDANLITTTNIMPGVDVSGGQLAYNDTDLRLQINVGAQFEKLDNSGDSYPDIIDPIIIVLRVMVKVGDKYLRYRITGGQHPRFQLDGPTWVDTPDYIEFFRWWGGPDTDPTDPTQYIITDDDFYFYLNTELLTPKLSTAGLTLNASYAVTINIETVEYYARRATTPTPVGNNIILTDITASIIPHDGNNALKEKTETVYNALVSADNSEIYEIQTPIGTGPKIHSHSNILVWNGLRWDGDAQEWTKDGTGSPQLLEYLLADQIAALRSKPMRLMSRAFYAPTWEPGMLLKWRGWNFIFLNYEYDTSRDEVNAQWAVLSSNPVTPTKTKSVAVSPLLPGVLPDTGNPGNGNPSNDIDLDVWLGQIYSRFYDDVTADRVVWPINWQLPDPAGLSDDDIRRIYRVFSDTNFLSYNRAFGFTIDYAAREIIFLDRNGNPSRNLQTEDVQLLFDTTVYPSGNYAKFYPDQSTDRVVWPSNWSTPNPANLSDDEIRATYTVFSGANALSYNRPFGFTIDHAAREIIFLDRNGNPSRILNKEDIQIFIKT